MSEIVVIDLNWERPNPLYTTGAEIETAAILEQQVRVVATGPLSTAFLSRPVHNFLRKSSFMAKPLLEYGSFEIRISLDNIRYSTDRWSTSRQLP